MYWAHAFPAAHGYPPTWTPTTLTVCVSASHSGTLDGALTMRVKEAGNDTVAFLIKDAGSNGGSATTMTDACFADSAASSFPGTAAGQPFSGSWRPFEALQPLMAGGLGTATGPKISLGVYVKNGATGTGTFISFRVQICYRPNDPPSMPPPDPAPPSPPPSPQTVGSSKWD